MLTGGLEGHSIFTGGHSWFGICFEVVLLSPDRRPESELPSFKTVEVTRPAHIIPLSMRISGDDDTIMEDVSYLWSSSIHVYSLA